MNVFALVVCPLDDDCDPDVASATSTRGAGAAPIATLNLLLETDDGGWTDGVDQRTAFGEALARAEAAAEKRRWATARAELDAAEAALARLRGTVSNESLFRLWFLRGAERVATAEDQGFVYAFRQAAAIADGSPPPLPAHDEATERAWQDESRKLVVGGRGTLALDDAGEGVRYVVDGRTLAPGPQTVELLPGNHRIGALHPRALRTWQAEVPVLAGRTVHVGAAFAESDHAEWAQARIVEAFDTLAAPPEVTALLANWAVRHDVRELELLHVDRRAPPPPATPPEMGPADPLRPASAAGEKADMGDGVPSTYEDEVAAEAEAIRQRPPTGEPRVRVVWFDAAQQRFRPEALPVDARLDTAEPRFRASMHVGYVGMLGHHHGAVDVGAAWLAGRVTVEGRVGLVRSDTAYNLYPDWVDPQLYHLSLAARWAPPWRVAPYLAIGPEVYVPVSIGARLAAGAQVRVDSRWIAQIEGHGALATAGTGWGAGVGVARAW